MAIFGPKPWEKTKTKTFGKNVNFWTFWTSCFHSLERRFIALKYRNRHFPGLYCLKTKVGKMAIFGPKPWINPMWKNVNFSTFWTSCFYPLERRFFVLEYHKRHFPGLYCLKKKLENWPFLDQNHGLKPFGKNVNFSTFWTSCFYSLERRFFILEYRKRHFLGLYWLKKKIGKMAIFGQKPWVNPFGKMSIFRLFGLHVFIA